MTRRFFFEGDLSLGEITLEGAEAKHLAVVMRSAPGDEFTLFNGQGGEYRAVVQAISKKSLVAELVAFDEVERELPFELTLCVAAPKGERCKWLVEKATELGVSRLIFLRTERSVAEPTPKAAQRFERTVIEASKQCGRNRLMAIEPATNLKAVLSRPADSCTRLFGDPNAAGEPLFGQSQSPVFIAIGPEGGWSSAEVDQLSADGWMGVSLGERVLRIETAAIALVARFSRAEV